MVGLYCTKTKRVRWITVLAFLIFIAFFACMSTTNAHTRNAVWGYPVLMGTGLAMTLVALVSAGQLSVPPELIAVATGIMISVRSLGGTIGIAICTFPPGQRRDACVSELAANAGAGGEQMMRSSTQQRTASPATLRQLLWRPDCLRPRSTSLWDL